MPKPHDGRCEDLAEPHPDCFRCKALGIGVLASATPNRTLARRQPHRPVTQPSWEKGRAGEHRADGSFMPYLDKGKPIPVKQFAENRATYETAIRDVKQGHAPTQS